MLTPRSSFALVLVAVLASTSIRPARAGSEGLAAGGGRVVGVTSDGRAFQWGSVGNCYCPPRPVPTPDEGTLTDVTGVSATYHALALRGDGSVWSWGMDRDGQLGRGTVLGVADEPVAQRVVGPGGLGLLDGIAQVAAGDRFSLALRGSDGSVWAWGQNTQGQLGNGVALGGPEPPAPVPFPVQVQRAGGGFLGGVDAVAAGDRFGLALVDGVVWTWGRDITGRRFGQLTSVAERVTMSDGVTPLSGVAAISAGGDFALALLPDGRVLSWGQGWNGQLGNGEHGTSHDGSPNRAFPEPVLGPGGAGILTNVTSISAGDRHCLVRRSDGSAWSWGDGSDPQGFFFGPTNGLGLGVPATEGAPQATPAQVVGVDGQGLLGGVAESAPGRPALLVASRGHYAAYSVAMVVDGTLRAWGDNVYTQLQTGGQVPRTSPGLVCGIRLRQDRPVLTCPAVVESGSSYEVSWTAVPGAIGYELEVDGGSLGDLGPDTLSWQLQEPGPACLRQGFAHVKTFRVRALGEGCPRTDDDWTAPCTSPIRSPFTEPPRPPELACPQPTDFGNDVVITWPAASDAQSWEADADGDGFAELPLVEPMLALQGLAIGTHQVSVRGVSPCGQGELATCSVRVRPNTSACMTLDGLQVCGPGFVEDPPGTFTVESDWIRLGLEELDLGDYTAWIDGAVRLTPATGAAEFAGTGFVLTQADERFDLFDTMGEPEPPQGGVSQPVHGPFHFCQLPTSLADFLGPNDPITCGLRNLLTFVPQTTERRGVFMTSGLPYNGRVRTWFQKRPALFDPQFGQYFGCIVVQGTARVPEVPGSPGVAGLATVAICPQLPNPLSALPAIRGVVNVVQVTMAGCTATVTNGTLDNRTPGNPSTPWGIRFPMGTVRCPNLGALKGQVGNVFVAPGILDIGGGTASMGSYDLDGLGLVTLRQAEGQFVQRTPPTLGYSICGQGRAGFKFLLTDLQFGFTLNDARVQKACANVKPLREIEQFFRFPLYFDRFGGCLRLTERPIYTGDACAGPQGVDFAPPAPCQPSCLRAPTVEVHASLRLASPIPFGDGDLAKIGPLDIEVSRKGIRGGGSLSLLGRRIGTSEICASSDSAGLCASVSLADILTGSANLWLDEANGLSGRVRGSLDLPRLEVLGVGLDPPPVSLGVYFGPFEDDVPFVGRKAHWGLVSQVEVAWQKVNVGLDVRHLSPHVLGVRPLGRLAGIGAMPVGRGILAQASFDVAEGQAQVLFGGRSDAGPPVLRLMAPGGEILDASTEDVRQVQDEDATVLAVRFPEAGSWTVMADGLPDGSIVELSALGQPPSVTLEATEPTSVGSSRRVAWLAGVPAAALPRVLRVVASQDLAMVQDGVGFVLREQPLVDGAGAFDVPEGALPAGTWSFAVVASDEEGDVVVAVAPGALVVEDAEGPLPPTRATVVPLADGARVTWDASPSPDVAGYEVIVEDADDPESGVPLAAGRRTSLDVHGLPGDGVRRFLVRAFDTTGNDGEAIEAGLAAPDPSADATPPPAPQDLTVETDGTTLHLAWSADSDAVAWRVHYGPSGRLVGRQAAEGNSPVDAVTPATTLSGFTAGQTVFVAVSAVDALGNESPRSDTVSAFIGSTSSADGDALPDAWERLVFDSLGASDGSGDGDGDMLSDVDEHALGFDPLEPDAFAWGDVAPPGAPDGVVDIADVVWALRLAVGLHAADADALRRLDVVPATSDGGTPPVTRPTREEPRRVTIADVVMILRAAIGLTTFAEPLPQ